jgi:aryl-alcohol dehydrogenase
MALVGAYPFGVNLAAEASFLMSGGCVIRSVVEGGADPHIFIPQLIEYYCAGRFPFDRLIRSFDFADTAHAIEQGETGKVIKSSECPDIGPKFSLSNEMAQRSALKACLSDLAGWG